MASWIFANGLAMEVSFGKLIAMMDFPAMFGGGKPCNELILTIGAPQ
jgi:hypothetical protein